MPKPYPDLLTVLRLERFFDQSTKEVIKKEVKFYTHTNMQAGVKLKVWKKVGNIPLEEEFDLPTFRHTEDTRDPNIKKSYNWYIWKVNVPTKDIGELTQSYTSLSVGGLTHPLDIVKRLKTGQDVFDYPL
jgi:hypothetical protein